MKKMFTAALAAMMIMTAGTAMAASAPNFDFDGSILTRYDINTGAADKEGGKIFFRLNAKSELSKDVSVYARFATERLTGDYLGADFDTSGYYTANSATAIDRFGVVIKGKDFNYNIGRQDAFLGQGLLFDSAGYMGINMGAFDGITISGKSGVTNLKVIAGQAWTSDSEDIKAYAIDASYSPAKDWTLGATVLKQTHLPSGVADGTYYAVNAAYTTGKATLSAEYGKSNYDASNKAYAFGVSYGIDSKNSAYAFYSNVEALGSVLPGLTTYDPNGKGMYYGFNHKLSKDYTLGLFYKDMKFVAADGNGHVAGEKYTSFRTSVTYKF